MYEKYSDGETPSKADLDKLHEKDDIVNGREQEKIEKFLDEKGIETINFQK